MTTFFSLFPVIIKQAVFNSIFRKSFFFLFYFLSCESHSLTVRQTQVCGFIPSWAIKAASAQFTDTLSGGSCLFTVRLSI